MKTLLALAMILLSSFCLFGQTSIPVTEIPSSDLLVNGRLYYSQRPRASGHPLYPMDEWTPGTLYIKGERFEVESLIYDTEQNVLVLQHFVKGLGLTPVCLNQSLIDSFQVNGIDFVNVFAFNPEIEPGFYEKIYSGDFELWTQKKKSFIETFTASYPQGKYSALRSDFFIFEKGKLTRLENERSLKKYFIDENNEIKKYLRREGFYFKTATYEDLIDLMKFCDALPR